MNEMILFKILIIIELLELLFKILIIIELLNNERK